MTESPCASDRSFEAAEAIGRLASSQARDLWKAAPPSSIARALSQRAPRLTNVSARAQP